MIVAKAAAPYDEGGEFIGGRVTGPIFRLNEWSLVLFVMSAVMIWFQRRVAYAIALGACATSLPLNLYSMAPWALAGIAVAAVTAIVVLRDWNTEPSAAVR